MMKMIEFSEAFKKGWDDYYGGNHFNYYRYDTQGHAFRAWIGGYDAAKYLDSIMEDVE